MFHIITYGTLDRGMPRQMCRKKFPHKETL